MGSNPIILIMRRPNNIVLDFNRSVSDHIIPHYQVMPTHLAFLNKIRMKYTPKSHYGCTLSTPKMQSDGYTTTPLSSPGLGFNVLLRCHFLRKERIYTKLKYSRSPAYDIVSGGAAALLAGFIGFLISEKFGYELVDSGDFYYLFMYIVFMVFALRPILTTMSVNEGLISTLSPLNILKFYVGIIRVICKRFR